MCDRVIVSIRSGKLSFHDWKSQGKVREFYYRRPVGTLVVVGIGIGGNDSGCVSIGGSGGVGADVSVGIGVDASDSSCVSIGGDGDGVGVGIGDGDSRCVSGAIGIMLIAVD